MSTPVLVTDDSALAGTISRSGEFSTTRWTLIEDAREHPSQNDPALEHVCRMYWYPLYMFVRRRGYHHEDAEDLVQGFFEQLIEKDWLKAAHREKGRLRSFLLLALKRHMASQWQRAHCFKRGGVMEMVSLDADCAGLADRSVMPDALSPEKAYEREWVAILLGRVLSRLESECAAQGKRGLFCQLRGYLSSDGDERSFAVIAERLSMSEGSLRVALYRLRQRYGELLRVEIGRTVDTQEAVEEEIRHLLAVVSTPCG